MHSSPLSLKDLRNVAHQMRRSGLSHIEIGGNDYRVSLTFGAEARAPAGEAGGTTLLPATVSPDVQTVTLCAPIPGIVWLWYPGTDEPFAPPGATVSPGEVLALVKVGLICLPVCSPVAGVVDALQVSQGTAVEYDSAILSLRKTGSSS